MLFYFRMSDINETVKIVNAAVMQMQDGLRDINTHIEAAMFSYHVAHDLERGRKHLTADVRRSITRVQQGMFTVKHRFERVVERVRALEREQRDRRDEEELLEAVEDMESPRKKLKVTFLSHRRMHAQLEDRAHATNDDRTVFVFLSTAYGRSGGRTYYKPLGAGQ